MERHRFVLPFCVVEPQLLTLSWRRDLPPRIRANLLRPLLLQLRALSAVPRMLADDLEVAAEVAASISREVMGQSVEGERARVKSLAPL